MILPDYKDMSVIQGRSRPRQRTETSAAHTTGEADEELLGLCFTVSQLGVLVRFDPVPRIGSKVSLLISFGQTPNPSEIPCTVRRRSIQHDPDDLQYKHLHPMEVWSLNRLINKLEEAE